MALYLGENQVSPIIMTNNPYGWLNPEAKYVGKLYEWNGTLDDTTYSSWTPSTTAGTILAAVSDVATYTISDKTIENAYFISQWNITPAYDSGTSMVSAPTNFVFIGIQYYYNCPANYSEYFSGNYTSYSTRALDSAYWLAYYNSSGTLSSGSVSYGPAYTTTATSYPSVSSGNSVTVSMNRPALSARCSDTYFSTSTAAAIDTTHSTINYRIDVFKGAIEENVGTNRYRLMTAALNGNYGF